MENGALAGSFDSALFLSHIPLWILFHSGLEQVENIVLKMCESFPASNSDLNFLSSPIYSPVSASDNKLIWVFYHWPDLCLRFSGTPFPPSLPSFLKALPVILPCTDLDHLDQFYSFLSISHHTSLLFLLHNPTFRPLGSFIPFHPTFHPPPFHSFLFLLLLSSHMALELSKMSFLPSAFSLLLNIPPHTRTWLVFPYTTEPPFLSTLNITGLKFSLIIFFFFTVSESSTTWFSF